MDIAMRIMPFACVAAASAAFGSGPRLLDSGVSVSQDEASRRVTVTYSLAEEPGIVTFSVQTNDAVAGWVDVGGEAVSCVYGDVNRVVTNTVGESSFVWIPDGTWPDRHIADGSLRATVSVWPTNDPPDYAVVEPRLPGGVSYYTGVDHLPGGITNAMYRRSKFLLRRIRATGARFTMGAPDNETGYDSSRPIKETPHVVTLTNDYYMGVFEVTQDQYRLTDAHWDEWFYFTNLPYSAELPVTGVHYDELRGDRKGVGGLWSSTNSLHVAHGVASSSFFGILRAMTGVDFDLPTEAEWEYACRAGTAGPTYAGGIHDKATLDEIAWHYGNSESADHAIARPQDETSLKYGTLPRPGGLKKPNAWGLYDMIGNVQEWCLDNSCTNLGSASVTSPMGRAAPVSGTSRMTRGGSFIHDLEGNRAGRRDYTTSASHKSWNGFRLSCPCPLTKKW